MSSQSRVAALGHATPVALPANARERRLSASTQQTLCRRWQIFGDRAARDRLVAAYQGWIARLARGFMKYGVDGEELLQEGWIGLLTALARFRPRRARRLTEYVVYWIRLRMIVLVARGRDPVALDSLALRRCAVGDDDLAAPESDGDAWSLDDRRQRRRARGLPNTTPNAEATLIDAAESERQRAWLQQALAAMSAAERAVLQARHLEDQPVELEAMARQLDRSPKAVRALESRALAQLFAAHDAGGSACDVLVAGRRLRVRPLSIPARTNSVERT